MTKPSTAWKPGQSGNPRGRPQGSGQVAVLRQAISEAIPAIVAQMVERAKEGDVAAARLLLERTIPPLKPVELPVAINFPAASSLTEQAQAVIDTAASGQVAPSQAASLLAGLAAFSRIIEVDELEKRISRLEDIRDGRS